MKICIDPGHSGPFEPGACFARFTEAAINLEVAKITARMLEKFGHKVLLTRTGDVDNHWMSWRCWRRCGCFSIPFSDHRSRFGGEVGRQRLPSSVFSATVRKRMETDENRLDLTKTKRSGIRFKAG